jgi:DNA invertase Pin-like site-specific DNA recombinase
LEVCRRYLRQLGWNEVATYEDKAISGASRFRPGFQALLSDAEKRRFDVIVCEAVDRLGRKLADVADFHDRLTFFGVDVHAVGLGLVTQMHIGIMGTMAQLTLGNLRAKTIRGQLGRARLGRIPGGLAYGYDIVVPPAGSDGAGERRINADEAQVVRRIFRNNTLYIGRLSWNRCSYVKDPRTGKRVARVNPTAQREIVEVPDLRIIDQALWGQARQQQSTVTRAMARDGNTNPLNRAHRGQFLLSGLLSCGGCGGAYTIIGKDRYGCATRRGKATCDNARTVARQAVERRVLAGLKERLLAPDMVEAFIRAFAAEAAERRRDAARSRASRGGSWLTLNVGWDAS